MDQHTSPKIQAEHLARQALIYIRQSTMQQVKHNTGSTSRQYDLTERALALGWPADHIQRIDQDQAHSAVTSLGRDGFQQVVAEVGLGRVGAVFSLEASRLARANSDWYRLLEICRWTNTLVIDEDGIYDLRQFNDQLVLGMKGQMSEAELHWLKQRMWGGKLAKAQKGELRMAPPTGLVYDEAGRIVLDPDEEIQAAVRLVLSLFEQYRSAMAVVSHFTAHGLSFPERQWGGAQDGEVRWGPLQQGRVLAILHNPAYAGAYVFGRTRTDVKFEFDKMSQLKARTRQVKSAQWRVLRLDAHVGYISWEQFERNQQQLADNRTNDHEQHRGAIREGRALLQGVVLCGRCGRRMSVRYWTNGSYSYECNQVHTHLGGRTCQTLVGNVVDAAVTERFLAAIQPAELEVSLATFAQLEAQTQQTERQGQLRLERLRYEADLAGRRFRAVDPDHRLVARNLERDWNECLTHLEEFEHEQATLSSHTQQPLTDQERQQVLALARDLPQLWQAPTTTAADRKQLLRLLIADVTLTRHDPYFQVGIRWQTGALTAFQIPTPQPIYQRIKTPQAVIERIQELAPDHSDTAIAQQLNAENLHPGHGGTFTRGKISWIRGEYRIPTGCPDNPVHLGNQPRGDGRYSARAAAALLNVNVSTIARWCAQHRLDYVQAAPGAPLWIALTPQLIAQLRKPVPCHRNTHPLSKRNPNPSVPNTRQRSVHSPSDVS